MKHPVAYLKYSARSDIGLVRQCNEDVYAVGGGQSDEYPGSLFVVCDGTGGQGVGDVAAQFASHTIIEAYYASEDHDRGTALVEAFRKVNKHAYQQVRSQVRSGFPTGWTTAIAVLFLEGKFYIAHAGIERVYRFQNNHLRQITEDHELYQQWIRQGIIPKERAKYVSHKHVLRSMGEQENLEVDLFVDKLRRDDVILLCTDGVLFGFKEEADLERIIRENPPQDVVGHLIDQANAHGGPDNATAILIWCHD